MAQSAPAWDDLPSGNEPSSAAASGSQQSAASPPAWDDLPDEHPAWDDLPDQPQPKAEGPIRSFVRHAANAVIPGLAGLAGAGGGAVAGAELGAPLGPVGAMVGGFVGGAAGALGDAYLASKAQGAAKEVVGLDDSAQAAIDAQKNPVSSGAGDIAGSMIGMNPAKAASLMQRGAAALVGGGIEAGQQAAGSEDWDPAKIAMSAGAFAAAPNTNRLGEAAENVGRTVARRFIPGRPGVVAPAADPARVSEKDTSPATLNTERSENLYGKAMARPAGEKDMLDTGDVAKDVAAALDTGDTKAVEPWQSPLMQSGPTAARPNEGNPGEQIPLDTGIEKAAAAQPPGGRVDTGLTQQAPVTAAVTKPQNGALTPQDGALTLSQDKTRGYDKPAEQARYKAALADPEVMREFAAEEGVSVEEAREIAEANYEPSRTEHVAKAAKDANPEPTPGQIDGDNYQKGHPPGTFAGKKVSIETAAGSIRKSKPGALVPWEVTSPYHYGDLKGTSAADSTKAKRQGVDIAFDPEGGENHYVVDQKDADTGKFDEHKIFADTTTPERVRDLYNAGFSDGRGPERLGALTKASEDDLKAWLANPAKKTKPYAKNFEEGVQRPVAAPEGEETLTDQNAAPDANVTEKSQSIPSEAAPAEAEAPPDVMAKLRALEAQDAEPEPRPAIVDKVIKQMRDAGYEKAARVYERLPVEEQIEKAPTVYRIATTGEAPAKPLETARLPGNRDALKVKMGDKVVEAKNKTEAAQKQAAYDGLKAAFDKHVPPEGVETPEATRARADALYKDAAQHMIKLKAADKPPEYALAKYARDLTQKKIGPAKFVSEEALLRDPDKAQGPKFAKQTRRIEADKDLRRGPTVEQAEQAAPDLEETPDSAEVKNIKDAADLPTKKPDYDMSKPEDREKVADALLKAGENQMGHNGGPPLEETVSQRIARQKAARLAAKGEPTPAAKAEYGNAIAKAHAKDEVADAKRADLQKAVKKKGVVKDLYDHYVTDTLGKGLGAAEGAGAVAPEDVDITSKVFGKPGERWNKEIPKSSFARQATSGGEEAGRSVDDLLRTVGAESTNNEYDNLHKAMALPPELNNKGALERTYFAWERGDLKSLPPEEEAAFNRHLAPVFEEAGRYYDAIHHLAPDLLGDKTLENHIMRITKGSTADYNILKKNTDPVDNEKLDLSAVRTRAKATGLARTFAALQNDATGARSVIGIDKGGNGYTVFKDGVGTKVKDPDFAFKEGEKYSIKNPVTGNTDNFTMTKALTNEIEDHARFENGMKARYYHNSAMSAFVAHQELHDILSGLLKMEEAKDYIKAQGLGAPRGQKAGEGWRETVMPNFAGWKLHPHIADVLDDFAKPGLNDSALDVVRRVNTALAKTLFFNPVPHSLNELTKAFVARGHRWLMPTAYRTLANTGSEAIKSVWTQNDLQAEIARSNGSLIYRSLRMGSYTDSLAKALGEDIEKRPWKWDPFAKKFGIGPSDLVKGIYSQAGKMLWSVHDVVLTQAVLERMHEGLSMHDAIVDAERQLPSYRMPAQLLTDKPIGRTASKVMQEKAIFMFNNYHHALWNGMANDYKDLVHGNARSKGEAAGRLLMLGSLAFGIYPLLDKGYQELTGNKHASAQRRGPLSIPSHVVGALQGKENFNSFTSSTFTAGPLTSALGQVLFSGKDFTGKPIIDPGTLAKAAKGSPGAAVDVAGEAAGYAARSALSPYSTATTAWHKGDTPGAVVRDQLLDIKNPSAASAKRQANLGKINAAQTKARQKRPADMIEAGAHKLAKGINKLVGH